jgi:hypothetical protein
MALDDRRWEIEKVRVKGEGEERTVTLTIETVMDLHDYQALVQAHWHGHPLITQEVQLRLPEPKGKPVPMFGGRQ